MNPFFTLHQRYLAGELHPPVEAKFAMPIRRERVWVMLAVGGLIFFVLRLGMLATAGWNAADEAWILQIVHRMSLGETLYKDVFFNCTPAAIYLARDWCALFGQSALAVKALCALIEMGIFLATVGFLRTLMPGVARGFWKVLLTGVVMLVIPVPTMAHLYNSLAILLALLGGIAVLRYVAMPGPRGAVVVGILLGLAVGEKQNMGAYLSLASAGVMFFAGRGSVNWRAAHVALTTGVAVVVLALILLPTLNAGAGRQMLVDTVWMKQQYLAVGSIPFRDGFSELGRLAKSRPFDVAEFIGHLLFPLTIVAGCAFIAGLVVPRTQRPLMLAAPFLLVLAAAAYPRSDAWHVANAYPAMVIALAVAATAWPVPVKAGLMAAAGVFAGCAALALLGTAAWKLSSRDHVFSAMPHLGGVVLEKAHESRLHAQVAMLARAPKPVLILMPEASGMHLISGTRNPTPYDYPISGELPPGSQEKIIEDLRAGRIGSVIYQPGAWWYSPLFVPEKLQGFVEEECEVLEDVGYQIRVFRRELDAER